MKNVQKAYLSLLISSEKIQHNKHDGLFISEQTSVFEITKYIQEVLSNFHIGQVNNIFKNLKRIAAQMEMQIREQKNMSEEHSQGDSITQDMLEHTNLIFEDLKKYVHNADDSPEWLLEVIQEEDESLQNLLTNRLSPSTSSKTNQQDTPIEREQLQNTYAAHLIKEQELTDFTKIKQAYQKPKQRKTTAYEVGTIIEASVSEILYDENRIKFSLGGYTGILDVNEIDFTNIISDEDIEYLLDGFVEGQQVQSRIIGIDDNKKHIYLSIRKLYEKQYQKVKQGDNVTIKVTDIQKDRLLGRITNTPLVVSMHAHEITRGLVGKAENIIAIGNECRAKVYFRNERNYELGVKCNQYGDKWENELEIEFGKWGPSTIA